MHTVSKLNGIDKLFREQNLHLLAFAFDSLMVLMSAASDTFEQTDQWEVSSPDQHVGYPIATVPIGGLKADGRPYGLGLMAQAGREDFNFRFMSAFEAHFSPRTVPPRVLGDDPERTEEIDTAPGAAKPSL